jgi:hypothetical protein
MFVKIGDDLVNLDYVERIGTDEGDDCPSIQFASGRRMHLRGPRVAADVALAFAPHDDPTMLIRPDVVSLAALADRQRQDQLYVGMGDTAVPPERALQGTP